MKKIIPVPFIVLLLMDTLNTLISHQLMKEKKSSPIKLLMEENPFKLELLFLSKMYKKLAKFTLLHLKTQLDPILSEIYKVTLLKILLISLLETIS